MRCAQPNFSAPTVRHSRKWREENGKLQPFVDFRLIGEAKLHRVHLELERELIHGGLGGVKAGNRAGAAHRRGRADIAPRQGGRDAQVRHAVHVRRALAAVLLVVVEDGSVIHIFLPQGGELALGVALRRTRC